MILCRYEELEAALAEAERQLQEPHKPFDDQSNVAEGPEHDVRQKLHSREQQLAKLEAELQQVIC